MLPPNTIAIRQLSQEEGISEAILHKSRAEARGKGQLLPDADAGPEGWSSRDKFAAVLDTAALNEADLAEYRRKRGLYPAQITAWLSACEQPRTHQPGRQGASPARYPQGNIRLDARDRGGGRCALCLDHHGEYLLMFG